MKRVIGALVIFVSAASIFVGNGGADAVSTQLLVDNCASGGPTYWSDNTTRGNWHLWWNGQGTAGETCDIGPSGTYQTMRYISPKPATSPDIENNGFFTSVQTFGDQDITAQVRTNAQLRQGSPPSPWETAWVLFHFQDNRHFYYINLKPNGWELGKEDPDYPGGQRFLASVGSPRFALGQWHTVRVVQRGNLMSVFGDGTWLTNFTDQERPYMTGSVGLYCEDASVYYTGVQVLAP